MNKLENAKKIFEENFLKGKYGFLFNPRNIVDDRMTNKIKKCEYCDGKGLVQIAPNVRGLKKCQHCGGAGGTVVLPE